MKTGITVLPVGRYHASNELFAGGVTDFPEAMRLYGAQMEQEFDGNHPGYDPEDTKDYAKILADAKRDVWFATHIWNHYAPDAAAVVAALRRYNMSEFADALESGDYSALAV